MYLKAKANKSLSAVNEFAKLKQQIAGPFLKAKKTVNINEEFKLLLKKFDHLYKTPCIKTITPSEKTTEKLNKVRKIVYEQVKISSFYAKIKSNNLKHRVSI